ncbi:MAG: DUF881 domain-containing protein [Candidatus Dormibacteria bacterium]
MIQLDPRESRTRLLTVLAVTFVLAAAVTAQVKAELIPTSNQVARDQALVQSVQSLEHENANLRADVVATGARINGLNSRLASQSAEALNLQHAIRGQRDVAGLTPVQGPGVVVELGSGPDPHAPNDASEAWLVRYIDIQDVVNVLWASGAEAVSVNHQRVVPDSSFYQAGSDVLLNGVHLRSPYELDAIGDSGHFNQALGGDNNLSELKSRSQLYQLKFTWHAERGLRLAAFDGAFVMRYAVAGQ